MTTYVATEGSIYTLTTKILQGENIANGGRATYLSNLVATVQKELGAKERTNMARGKALDEEGITAQASALAAVHERFYAAVLKACGEVSSNSKEVNRLSNFARTAKSAVLRFIRAGKDLTALAPGRITKTALSVPTPPKPISAKRLHAKAVRESKALVATLLALQEADKDAASAEVEMLLGVLGSELTGLKLTDTRGGKTLFLPTGTQLARGASLRKQ